MSKDKFIEVVVDDPALRARIIELRRRGDAIESTYKLGLETLQRSQERQFEELRVEFLVAWRQLMERYGLEFPSGQYDLDVSELDDRVTVRVRDKEEA